MICLNVIVTWCCEVVIDGKFFVPFNELSVGFCFSCKDFDLDGSKHLRIELLRLCIELLHLVLLCF